MTIRCRAGRPFNSCSGSRHALMVLLLAVTALPVVERASAETEQPESHKVEFDIPAQSVPAALKEFARQANLQLFFISDGFEDIKANAVIGIYSAQHALHILLAGTGLTASVSPESGVKVGNTSAPMGLHYFSSKSVGTVSAGLKTHQQTDGNFDAPVEQMESEDDGILEQADKQIEEILVTGTSIRGVIPESSPLEIYNAIDIRNTGALTVEQFVSTLPQNNNTLSELGTGTSSRESNGNSSNSVDLRGLGVGSTLVLLNGRRMAPSSLGRSADLSFIPIGVVERVEVLTDGASAIYGADAIGGVINFVLKDQQDNAETVVAVAAADGGTEQVKVDQSFGFNWRKGHALLALSYLTRNELDAADRAFARAAAPFTLVPADIRRNVLATVSQVGPDNLKVSADFLYSDREPKIFQTRPLLGPGNFSAGVTDHEQIIANVEVEKSYAKKLDAALLLTFAEASSDRSGFLDGPRLGTGPFFEEQNTRSVDITAKIDGELAKYRTGSLKFALGIGYTEDDFEQFRDFSVPQPFAIPTTVELNRNTKYAFAELLIPIVGPNQGITGMQVLEFSLAARYTDYSDFGQDTSPKMGILWSPASSLKVRATFGESFKAPFLFQLDPNGGSNFFFPVAALGFPDVWTQDDSANVLFAQGPGNPTLGPEEAQTYTFGIDWDQSNFNISATYFNIEYVDRIAEPDSSGGFTALGSPRDFQDLFDLSPTVEEIASLLAISENGLNLTGIDMNDPVAVHAAATVFFDNRIQNLSISEMDGLDLSVGYTTVTSAGDIDFGVKATKILNFEERISPSAKPVSLVDTVLFPADLKGRGHIGYVSGRWSTRVNVNYVDDYNNPFDSNNPTVDSWTTVDLLLSYEFPPNGHGIWDGVRLNLSTQNVFDEDPPHLPVSSMTNTGISSPTGFDPANANPIGRFVSFQIAKTW